MLQLGQGTHGWPTPVRHVATKLFHVLDLETLKAVCAKVDFIVRPERLEGDREDWVAAAIDAVAAQHPPFLLSFGLSRGCLTKFFFACGDCNCGVVSLTRTKQLQKWAGLVLQQVLALLSAAATALCCCNCLCFSLTQLAYKLFTGRLSRITSAPMGYNQ